MLVLSHDRPQTLPLAVQSALAQTVPDLEVIIVGDGVTDAVRTVATRLQKADPRVVFLDLPKGEHRGETNRHLAILEARSDAIFYLCDDDLLLPGHVADLLELLTRHPFVQSRNGSVQPDGQVTSYPGSLDDREMISWLFDERVPYNFVSITGTAHSRDFYLRVGRPWSTTPAGIWPDHFQWRKMIDHPDFSGATSERLTALQFPASDAARSGWSHEQQFDEVARWFALIGAPAAQERIDHQLNTGMERQLARTLRENDRVSLELRELDAERWRLGRELVALRKTLSWRITTPLRAVRRLGSR